MEFANIDAKALALLEKGYGDYAGRILVGKSKFVEAVEYPKWYERHRNFECRPSDVWVVSYPKTGTTWTQEMVWCLLNKLDFKKSKEELLMKRFPFFEWDSLMPETPDFLPRMNANDPCNPGVTWNLLHSTQGLRTIKSHLHYEILPKGLESVKPKIIYVCRDPRDTCVSYYYHSKKLVRYIGDFKTFVDIFLEDLHFFSPYWKHLLDFWDRRNQENVLFLRYEELINDLPEVIQRTAKFLDVQITESDIERLSHHLSFDEMKKNRSVNNEAIVSISNEKEKKIPFMRKGQIGDWKNHFTDDHLKRFSDWTQKNLAGSDFPYYRDY